MANPESIRLARVWLAKAQSDLATARLLLLGAEKHLDTGSYHCQQAGEKALKSYLTAAEIPFSKTHSLEPLVDLCIQSSQRFDHFRDHAKKLTPLVHQFRYPGELADPSLAEAEQALALAEELCRFCEKQVAAQNE